MAILRADGTTEVTADDLTATSEDADQRARALTSLVADGLVTQQGAGPTARYRLPR
jgi:A/G-specific adenine glycosylase